MTRLIGNMRDVLPSVQGCNDDDPTVEVRELFKEELLCLGTLPTVGDNVHGRPQSTGATNLMCAGSRVVVDVVVS